MLCTLDRALGLAPEAAGPRAAGDTQAGLLFPGPGWLAGRVSEPADLRSATCLYACIGLAPLLSLSRKPPLHLKTSSLQIHLPTSPVKPDLRA